MIKTKKECLEFIETENSYIEMQDLLHFLPDIHADLYPKATLESQIQKYREEYSEWEHARVMEGWDRERVEAADMIICAIGIMRFDRILGYSLQEFVLHRYFYNWDIHNKKLFTMILSRKMKKNLHRTWNDDAFYKHKGIDE